MGWKKLPTKYSYTLPSGKHKSYFRPSSNIAQAMEGVQTIGPKLLIFELYQTTLDGIWVCLVKRRPMFAITGYATAKTAPLAITRALIMWAMGRD